MIHVNRFGACVRVHRDGLTDTMTVANAARLLAGLEVALAAALREAGRGKCLKCGNVCDRSDLLWKTMPLSHACHCPDCHGALSTLPGEG